MWKTNLDQLLYMEAINSNQVKLYYEAESYILNDSIKRLEDQLPNNQFLKVHPAFIVNLDMIERFDGNFLYIDKIKIPASIEIIKELKTLLLSSTYR